MLITCTFVDATNIECWAGDDYVVGDPNDPAGIVSDNGGLRVFAGLRDDLFFLEYDGFLADDSPLACRQIEAGRALEPHSKNLADLLEREGLRCAGRGSAHSRSRKG
jgi:hypothetical protein